MLVTDTMTEHAQIISYLTTHAHPQMFKNVSVSAISRLYMLSLTSIPLVESVVTDHRRRSVASMGPGTESTGQESR